MELHIHRVDHTEAIAIYGSVVFRVVRSATTEIADIDEAKSLMDRVLESSPTVGALVVVDHDAPVPSAAVRRHAKQVFGGFGERLIMCHVPLGLGFWAAAARLAMVTITALTGAPGAVESSVEAGAERISQELIGIDPGKLVAVYEQLVEHMRIAAVEHTHE